MADDAPGGMPPQALLGGGKLPADLLARLLPANHQPGVLLGPGIGLDAAVVEGTADRLVVLASDPITFAREDAAAWAVTVNANDVAVLGATPCYFLATLLLPPDRVRSSDVERLFADLRRRCEELGVALVGGHSEVTSGVERPIVVGTMVGLVERGRLVRGDGALPGDALLCTKTLPIEGLALLAQERADELAAAGIPEAVLTRARGLLQEPGLLVLEDARIARDTAPVHAMHDPTEGGVATALHELAQASGVGLRVQAKDLPLHPDARSICAALGLDPLGVIASGALLLALDPGDVQAVTGALERARIPCARIGRCTAPEEGCLLVEGGRERPLPRFEPDEVSRVL